MLSDGKWGVNGVCVTWQDLGAEGPERVGECPHSTFCLCLINHHQVTQTSFTIRLSISARLFCPENAPIELPGEEAI